MKRLVIKKMAGLLLLLLCGGSLFSQVDVGVVSLTNPTSPICGSSNQQIDVIIQNFSASTINFATDNVTVNVSITGASIQTFNSPVISSGSLAPGGTMSVIVTASCNLSNNGVHVFNATTVCFSDVNASNNAMAPVNIVVSGTPTTANAGSDQTLCVSGGTLNGNTPTIGIGTWTLISGSGIIASPNAPNSAVSGLGAGPNVFRWTISNPPCPDSFDDVTIVGDASPSLSLSSAPGTDAQTVCINTPISTINYTVGGSATGATVSGLPAGVSGNYSAGTFTISGSPSASGVFNYSINTTGGACAPANISGTITVTPDATITLSSAVGTDNQSLCVNNAITTITYTIGGSGTGATVSGLPAGVSGSFAAGTFTINGTPTLSGVYPYTVTATGACASAVANGIITVNPDATITLSSGSSNQTVCENTSITPIVFLIGGGGSGASVSGLPSGLTGTYASGQFTISGTPTTAGTYNYTVTTSGTCLQASFNGTITVDPNATIALSSAPGTDNQTVCISTAITPITYTIGGGGTGATVSGLPAGVNGSFAAGTFTISGTPTVSGVFNYTVTTTGTCTQTSMNGTLTIEQNATLTWSSGSVNQTICESTAIVPIVYSVSGSVTSVTATGLPVGITDNLSGGTYTISGTALMPGVYNYTINATGNCLPTSANGTITVDPNGAISLSSAPGTDNQSLCVNNAITPITYTIGGGATSAMASGLPPGVSGSFSAGTLTISGTPTLDGVYPYMVETFGSCTQDTLYGTITVNPDATILLISGVGTDAQSVCENTAISPIAYVIGGGGTGATVSGLPAGVSGSFSGGTFTISGTPTLAGIYNYTVNTTGTCLQTSINGSITVVTGPSVALTSAVGTDSQSVCINTPIFDITYSVGGSASGVTVSGLPAGISSSFSGGVLTISGTPTVFGLFSYSITTTGGSCPSVTTGGTIQSTMQTISLSSAPFTNDQHLCFGNGIDTITYLIGGSGTGATVSDLPAGVAASFSGGILTISGTPTQSGTFHYVVDVTGFCTPISVIGSISITSPILSNVAGASTSFCESDMVTLGGSQPSGGDSLYTYLWEFATTPVGPFVPAFASNSSMNYMVPASILPISPVYFRRIVYSGGCSDTSAVVTITIDSLPTVSISSAAATICAGDTFAIASVAGAGVNLNWTHDGAGSLSGSTTSTPVYSSVAADENSDITFTVAATTTNSCAAQTVTETVTLSVLPLPVAISGGSTTVCPQGDPVTVLNAVAQNGTINWSHNGNGILLDSNLTIPTYYPSIADAGNVVNLQLIVSNPFACQVAQSDTALFSINVLPVGNISVNAGPDQTISLGESVELTGSGSGIVLWQWSPASAVSSPNSDETIVTPDSTTVFVLTGMDLNGCIALDSVMITVNTGYDMMIANLLTPNGDSKNDTWIIDHIEWYPNTEVIIINREGQEVYTSSDYDNSWDGTRNGKKLPDATYYYVVKFADSEVVRKGAVTILRN